MVPTALIAQEESDRNIHELSALLDVDSFPPYYLNIFERLGEVRRYKDDDLPEDMISDTVDQHTLRGMERINNLFKPRSNSMETRPSPISTAVVTFFIHDFAEVEIGDVNVVHGPKSKEARKAEDQIMRQFLRDREYQLYQSFEAAGDYLNGIEGAQLGKNLQDRAALLAKLVDSIDGNVIFHKAFSKWAFDGNDKDAVPEKYIHWMFSQYDRYLSKIAALDIPEREKIFFSRLLHAQILEIRDVYKGECLMPEVLKAHFNRFGLIQ